MAEDRITLAVLRKILAQKVGVSEDIAGTFLTHLFPVVVNGLRTDKQVRINGLGTFKLQSNAPRRSVNVQTGETMLIEGFNKVVFTPEVGLREQINMPFAHLESMIVDEAGNVLEKPKTGIDPLEKLGEQAEEIKDILAELGGTDAAPVEVLESIPAQIHSKTIAAEDETEPASDIEEENIVNIVTEQVIEEVVEPIAEPIVESVVEPIIEPIVESVLEPTAEEVVESIVEPIITPPAQEEAVQDVPVSQPLTKGKAKKQPKAFRPWLIAGITMVTFCVFLVISFFVLQQRIMHWADNVLHKQDYSTVLVNDTDEDFVDDTTQVAEVAEQEDIVLEQERVYTEFITTETLTEGSRLTWLSRKYYGAPNFWVYIYEANQEILPNPNEIPVGVPIRIPKLPAVLTDINNPASMNQAQMLHNQILGGK